MSWWLVGWLVGAVGCGNGVVVVWVCSVASLSKGWIGVEPVVLSMARAKSGSERVSKKDREE